MVGAGDGVVNFDRMIYNLAWCSFRDDMLLVLPFSGDCLSHGSKVTCPLSERVTPSQSISSPFPTPLFEIPA